MAELTGKRVAILATDMFEQVELVEPTSWPSLKTDIRNAGGDWQDRQVIVDDGLVTSRKPADIPAFNEKIIEEFAKGRHARQAESVGAARAK
jgi:protease I